ncbi:sensor histidine kinase [Desulforhabdus amnigena]|jgi:signal transduction histidine kinase|uniref:histidine kinase n=1 Tax=Desulforhabdus amnigena TaxID=40218 RepID=A0A9W6FT48_9BACT|nr:ATP-binding protein [Desulforhabdus amnigena]NLJ27748.1 HAMP domain-containing protein [Deltaproteobacteria bacterium]GLI32960.1 two-component sensor histidine kinase [Desulforhabdus amnigena]
MHWPFPLYLNIRQKVLVGLILCIFAIGSIGMMSLNNLKAIEKKQHLLQVADDLGNIILEIRRYEKNYLLYGSSEDLNETHKYLEEAQKVLARISPEEGNLKAVPLLNRLREELLTYKKFLNQMTHKGSQNEDASDSTLQEHTRESGKSLVDLSQELVILEHRRILYLLNTLKAQLLASLGILLLLGLSLVSVVANKIVRPLRVIEKTTLRIAEGDFQPIPVLQTHDETQRVVEALNRMVAELEKRQDQLVQAEKLSSLGILSSGIAHQLNNPLNNISTSCQILLEELDEGDKDFARRMLNNVEGEVHRARDIVRGLLEFSRAKEFSLAPASLSQVVERSVRLISSQVPPGIEVLTEIPEGLTLNLDFQQMQQVFLNLTMNAIQAIKNPPGRILIRAEINESDGEKEALIQVKDSGIGIPAENISHVFDPFFTTKEVGKGTGLGLSVVYGIVQKHQGTISVESREGEGTCFTIRLPLPAVNT